MTNRIIGAAAIAGALLFTAYPSAGYSASLFDTFRENQKAFMEMQQQTFEKSFALTVKPASKTSPTNATSTAKVVPAKKSETALKGKIAEAKRIADQEAARLASFNNMMKAFDGMENSAVEMQRKKLKERADKAAMAHAKLAGSFNPGTSNGTAYHAIIAKYANAYGVPLKLAHAVVRVESNYRANARGQAGEIGLMQIKPATARGLGYTGSAKGLYNPETNIKYGMKYLGEAHRLANGSTCGTILKYNAGYGATKMNPISARYCKKVARYI